MALGMSQLRTITEGFSKKEPSEMKKKMMKKGGEGSAPWNIHPGEVLREEFLRPLEMSSYELAKRVRVPAPRINDIVLEKRGITADTAVRLAKFFGTSEGFWMNLQSFYEIRTVKERIGKELGQIRPQSAKSAA
jgi:addiction module HigA family antidote